MGRRLKMRRIPRRRGALTGVLLILLGLFAALIPFVGPYFNYQIGTTDTWDWSMDRLWLSVLPGAAAALGGLIMLRSTRRSSASFGGLLALAGGLWLVAGPTLSMLWNDGTSATGAAIGDNGTRVLEWIGFFYGTGALITLFASYGLGFLAALPVVDEAVRPAEGAPRRPSPATETAPAAPATPATAPAGAQTQDGSSPQARPEEQKPAPTRRRGFLRRRREPAERR
jgi:hypothetical protein